MEKVILMGRMVADPELKQTQSGVKVTSFTVAANRKFKSKDGNYVTDFHKCVSYNNTAEFICRYFKKGQAILVVGELQNRSWESQEGEKRFVTEVSVEEAYFAGDKKSEQALAPLQQQSMPYAQSGTDFEQAPCDDDLPF